MPGHDSSTELLTVSLFTVLAAVAGVVAVALTSAGWAVLMTLVLLLVGLALVGRTMFGQLADDGDDA